MKFNSSSFYCIPLQLNCTCKEMYNYLFVTAHLYPSPCANSSTCTWISKYRPNLIMLAYFIISNLMFCVLTVFYSCQPVHIPVIRFSPIVQITCIAILCIFSTTQRFNKEIFKGMFLDLSAVMMWQLVLNLNVN